MSMNPTRAWLIAVVVVALPAPSVGAQTLSSPRHTLTTPDPKWVTPPLTNSKSPSRQRAKSCSEFGAGFVYVPSADTCVKAGGSVEVDVRGSR
jgi:hypothetical protein